MELRSYRSRSRTPAFESQQNEMNYITSHRVTRSTKTRTIQEEEHVSIQSEYKVEENRFKSKESEYNASHKENQVNHALESAKHIAENEELVALKMYRDAKEYWLRYPKTDYTYSPHSRDRVELAPGVVNMPNMSRKSIRNIDHEDSCNSLSHKSTNTSFLEEKSNYTINQHTGIKSINNNDEYLKRNGSVFVVKRSTIIKRAMLVASTIWWIIQQPFTKFNVLFLSLLRIVHRTSSKLLMLDTWLLCGSYSSYKRSNGKAESSWSSKTKKILLLSLLPLILFAGLWLLSAVGHSISEVMTIVPTTKTSRGATSDKIESESRRINLIEDAIRINEDVRPPLYGESNHVRNSPRTALTLDEVLRIADSLKHLLKLNADDQTAAEANEQIIELLADKVGQSSNFQQIVRNINSNQIINDQYERRIKELESQINSLRVDLSTTTSSSSSKYLYLVHVMKRCCRLNADHLNSLILTVMNSPEQRVNMLQWLNTLFISHHVVESKLNAVNKRVNDLIELNARDIMDRVSILLASGVASSNGIQMPPNERQIRAIVKQVLATYDADKTGLVDYALESAGGQVLSTRCTEHYTPRTSVVSVFSIPLWYSTSSPRTVITPGVLPGECWAFQSFPGFLIIKLSHNVTIHEFSYEHVAKELIPSGKLDSAPNSFQVFGLNAEDDREPVLLGEYHYDAQGDALQFFSVANASTKRTFQVIELKVNSNHGNPNYTCLYRFRVHGQLIT